MTLRMPVMKTAAKTACRAYFLGTIDYPRACRLQENLSRARAARKIGDTLLILEHPPVLSVGKAGYSPEHIRVTRETLEREHISICQTSRGGGITYHGPGQLVCYPIFDLRGLGLTVRLFIHKLEEVVAGSLANFDIDAGRLPGAPGVWVKDAEISSIGINVSHGITMHGFTVNVSNDLKHFSYIAACGVAGKKITTLSLERGVEIPIGRVMAAVIESFAQVFDIANTRGHRASQEGFYG